MPNHWQLGFIPIVQKMTSRTRKVNGKTSHLSSGLKSRYFVPIIKEMGKFAGKKVNTAALRLLSLEGVSFKVDPWLVSGSLVSEIFTKC